MKQILLMRHAKSDWSMGTADFERPLNKRGKKAAPFMGKLLTEKGITPNIILSSPALRAKTTAIAVAQSCNYKGEIAFHESFYFGYISEIFDAIRALPNEASTVFLFGHNPTWEMLVGKLTGVGVTMPSAAAALLEFDNRKWSNLKNNSCQLKNVFRPKDFM